jgi:hypothetical protein
VGAVRIARLVQREKDCLAAQLFNSGRRFLRTCDDAFLASLGLGISKFMSSAVRIVSQLVMSG